MEVYEGVIIENIHEVASNEALYTVYRENFDRIIKDVDPDTIQHAMVMFPDHLMIIAPLHVGALFIRRDFQGIYDFTSGLNLANTARGFDFYNGKLLKYYYLSLKYLGKGIDPLYGILAINREYGNSYSVAILTNCILDFQVNNNIYQSISVDITDPEETGRYSFYHGIINLVRGKYRDALLFFNTADILLRDSTIELKIKKYTIICKLLLGDFSILYPYHPELKPYFALIGAIRRAELSVFKELLEQYKEELFSMNIWFVARRLLTNLLREGLRKISICYSRISVQDINTILGVNARFLILSCLRSKFIFGRVEGGIFYGESKRPEEPGVEMRIAEVIDVRKNIKSMVRYPEIVPLTYESYMEMLSKNEQ